MAEIYIFSPTETDLTTFGLAGALEPISAEYEEAANGISELTIEHPLDENGKYKKITNGCKLVTEVPVRMTPEINGTTIVTSVQKASVSTTATTAQRSVYSKATGGSKLKTLAAGTEVVVTNAPSTGDRWKIKCAAAGKSVTGWIASAGLTVSTTEIIPNNANGIETVAPSWTVRSQIFRIYEVVKGMHTVIARARHISYDLIGNATTYKSETETGINTAAQGVLGNTIEAHDFTIRTNMADTRVGIDYVGKNPIYALLDEQDGITARFGCGLVRDNYELTLLKDPGMNRGVVIEYGKNMTGLSCRISEDDICTLVVPTGKDADGNVLYMNRTAHAFDEHIIGVHIDGRLYAAYKSSRDYPIPKIRFEAVNDAVISSRSGVTADIADTMLYEHAQKMFDEEGVDQPEVEMNVEFVNLGDTQEYETYANLEKLFLWDYATVRHAAQNINAVVRVKSIVWNVIAERMKTMELSNVGMIS